MIDSSRSKRFRHHVICQGESNTIFYCAPVGSNLFQPLVNSRFVIDLSTHATQPDVNTINVNRLFLIMKWYADDRGFHHSLTILTLFRFHDDSSSKAYTVIILSHPLSRKRQTTAT